MTASPVINRLRLALTSSSSRTTLWLFGSQVLAAGVSFLVNILASYSLAPDERGFLAFFLQLAYFLTVLMMMGIEKPFVAHVRGTWGDSVRDMLRLMRPGWLLLIAVVIASVWFLAIGETAVVTSLVLVGVFLMVNVHIRVVRNAYISSGQWKPFVGTSIAIQSVTLLSAVLLTWGSVSDSNYWLAGYVLAGLIATAVVLRSRSNARSRSMDVTLARTIRREGLDLIPASLGNTAMLRSDRLILPLLAGPEALGIYILVAASLEMTVWPVQQWADAKLSDWKKESEAGRRIGTVRTMVITAGSIALLCLGMSIFLLTLLEFVLPSAYAGSTALLLPLSLASVVYGVTRVQQGAAIAMGRGRLVSVAEIGGMIVSVVAYLVLIPGLGPLGAAVGSVIGYLTCLAMTWIGTRR